MMKQDFPKTCILMVNLGTPDAPTTEAVRRYLGEFLADTRVVEIPSPIWWLILHGIVLRVRPAKSAKAYRSIWTERGSPLLALTEDLAEAVRKELCARGIGGVAVEVAMRYGKPALKEKLQDLKDSGVERFIVLPLYPQYAAATAGSIFDRVAETFKGWRHVPELTFFSDYHLHDGYLSAVAASINEYWQANGKAGLLLFSLHGLPERCRRLGDPYYDQCVASTRAIAAKLGLPENAWKLVFQSRFGRQEWLNPYCVEVLKALPRQGIKSVDVVCPGFSVDCLETLEEIAIANKEVFLEAGGESYHYIPSLNDRPDHARALADLVTGALTR